MRVYPDVAGRRAGAIARDACVVALLVCFAFVGHAVHDTVDALAVLGTGVRQAGESVESGFDAAADAVDGVPLVGSSVADGLRGAGGGTGGNVAGLGRSGEDAVHRLANLLGWLTFLLPSAVLLALTLPGRLRALRRLNDASRALAGARDHERLLAMRAAFSLPYGQLLAYTPDPFGDLAAERYEPLVAAALEDAGLRPRR
jgi:hypothetical protein